MKAAANDGGTLSPAITLANSDVSCIGPMLSWSDAEMDLIVADSVVMLDKKLACPLFDKAPHKYALQTLEARSCGSI